MIVKERRSMEEEIAWAQHLGNMCRLCQGTGEVDDSNGVEAYRPMTCPECEGVGWLDEQGEAIVYGGEEDD